MNSSLKRSWPTSSFKQNPEWKHQWPPARGWQACSFLPSLFSHLSHSLPWGRGKGRALPSLPSPASCSLGRQSRTQTFDFVVENVLKQAGSRPRGPRWKSHGEDSGDPPYGPDSFLPGVSTAAPATLISEWIWLRCVLVPLGQCHEVDPRLSAQPKLAHSRHMLAHLTPQR